MTARSVVLRVLSAVVTLVFVLVFNFFLFRAVGNPKTDLARNPHLSLAGQEAVERGAEAIDIAGWTQGLEVALRLLGAHVGGRPQHTAGQRLG